MTPALPVDARDERHSTWSAAFTVGIQKTRHVKLLVANSQFMHRSSGRQSVLLAMSCHISLKSLSMSSNRSSRTLSFLAVSLSTQSPTPSRSRRARLIESEEKSEDSHDPVEDSFDYAVDAEDDIDSEFRVDTESEIESESVEESEAESEDYSESNNPSDDSLDYAVDAENSMAFVPSASKLESHGELAGT